jgi:alanyl-tRNA synthetase
MKRLSTNEIRQFWLDYYKDKGHAVVESSSLVPANDPTLHRAEMPARQWQAQ